jgi:hypothetical protein
MMKFRLALLMAFMSCTICALAAVGYDHLKRPMHIHKVKELALEIWTEAEPEWESRLEWNNGQATFVAETPALTYPPAGMTWVSRAGFNFSEQELEEGARGAVHQAARNYGVQAGSAIELKAAHYGDLAGYEAEFSANAKGTPVDVRVFCGRQPGKAAVVMQAFTLKGKLGHISEQIRRSWTNLRYLK